MVSGWCRMTVSGCQATPLGEPLSVKGQLHQGCMGDKQRNRPVGGWQLPPSASAAAYHPSLPSRPGSASRGGKAAGKAAPVPASAGAATHIRVAGLAGLGAGFEDLPGKEVRRVPR